MIEPCWQPRQPALPVIAALGWADLAPRLLQRALQLAPARVERLQAYCESGLTVLAGALDDLPWLPGIGYVGIDPAAPLLWQPATLHCNLPPDLLQRAVQRRAGAGSRWLLWPLPAAIRCLPESLAGLRQWQPAGAAETHAAD